MGTENRKALEEEKTEPQRYNGWRNYETWLVGLWIDNDEGSYRKWRAVANLSRYDLAHELKIFFELRAEADCKPGFARDLLTAGLSEVDWDEIASHLSGNEQ